jgi:phosphoribulokinase
VPDKLMRMTRATRSGALVSRPIMLAIAGDSAAGKTTLSRGLVEALGPDRCVGICVDDYHRFDRQERRSLPFTPLHPDCNYVDIIEQHLRLLATGHPILKPVYDHSTGTFTRPRYVEPRPFVIVEGLLPLLTPLTRACFDVRVYLDPPEQIRRAWKVRRDTAERGYTPAQVLAELERREPESEAYIRPQRSHADIVVRFAPIAERSDPPGTPLSVELLLRPTVPHPDLLEVTGEDTNRSMHMKLIRDEDGKPTDALHIHGYVPREDSRLLEKAIWDALGRTDPLPPGLGELERGERSEPVALTQLVLLYQLLRGAVTPVAAGSGGALRV